MPGRLANITPTLWTSARVEASNLENKKLNTYNGKKTHDDTERTKSTRNAFRKHERPRTTVRRFQTFQRSLVAQKPTHQQQRSKRNQRGHRKPQGTSEVRPMIFVATFAIGLAIGFTLKTMSEANNE